MTERQVRNGLKTWHRWLGLGAAVVVVMALTCSLNWLVLIYQLSRA